jgi:hypothetical protein
MSKKHHTTEKVTFEGFTGYYGSVPQGYGGFIWSDVEYLNSSYWQDVKTDWCDTGYQNVLDGSGLAYTSGPVDNSSYGYFRTENIKETFSLVSVVAASAWETNQPFIFIGYVYEPHKGFVQKASMTFYLSQTAQKIDFAQLSNLTSTSNPFSNISAVRIISHSGTYGNTCSYGQGHPTYGNELALDDLKVKWNGKVPHKAGPPPAKPLLLSVHGTPVSEFVNPHSAQGNAAVDGYHPELRSPPSHDTAGPAAQFHLPGVEHFGT